MKFAKDAIISFSSLPIRIVMSLGVTLMLGGFGYAAYMIFRKIAYDNIIPGFTTVWNIVSVLAPELRLCNPGGIWGADDKGSLWLGHIDIDAVHPDRLGDGGTHVCDDAGRCDFVPNTPRDEDAIQCIP